MTLDQLLKEYMVELHHTDQPGLILYHNGQEFVFQINAEQENKFGDDLDEALNWFLFDARPQDMEEK